jgi:hypothetical protein
MSSPEIFGKMGQDHPGALVHRRIPLIFVSWAVLVFFLAPSLGLAASGEGGEGNAAPRWEQVGWALNLEGALAAGVDVQELGSPSLVVPGFSERGLILQMGEPDLGWALWVDAKMVTRLLYVLTPAVDSLLDNDGAFTRVLEATLPFSPLFALRGAGLYTLGAFRLGVGPTFDAGFVGLVDDAGVETYELAMGLGLEAHLAFSPLRDLLVYVMAGPTYHYVFAEGRFTTVRVRPEVFAQYRLGDNFGLFGFFALPSFSALPGDGGKRGAEPYAFARFGLGVVFGI